MSACEERRTGTRRKRQMRDRQGVQSVRRTVRTDGEQPHQRKQDESEQQRVVRQTKKKEM